MAQKLYILISAKKRKTHRHIKDWEGEGVGLKTQINNKQHVLNSKLTSQYVHETIKKLEAMWMTELLLVVFCTNAGREELSCRRVKFSLVPTAVLLSYYIDFDEQIPLESPISTPIYRFRFTTFSQALVSLP